MNPETGRWETQDPDYDIYWQSKTSRERLSLAGAGEDLAVIEPCGRNGCGWDQQSREGSKPEKLKPYIDIISITAKQKALRYSLYIRYSLYPSRADLTATYTKGSKQGTFCEVEAKRCKDGFYDITKYSTYAAGLLR